MRVPPWAMASCLLTYSYIDGVVGFNWAIVAVFLWHQHGVHRCLACTSILRQSHDRGLVVSRCNQTKWRICTYLRRNRSRRFHALVEIRQDRRTPVVRLPGELSHDPNQSSASLSAYALGSQRNAPTCHYTRLHTESVRV